MVDMLTQILLFAHLLGFAALAGGLLVQLRAAVRRINGAMRGGAYWQLLTGLAMFGLAPHDYNTVIVGVKIGIILVIIVICEALRKKAKISTATYWLLLVLVIIQTALALSVVKVVPPAPV